MFVNLLCKDIFYKYWQFSVFIVLIEFVGLLFLPVFALNDPIDNKNIVNISKFEECQNVAYKKQKDKDYYVIFNSLKKLIERLRDKNQHDQQYDNNSEIDIEKETGFILVDEFDCPTIDYGRKVSVSKEISGLDMN